MSYRTKLNMKAVQDQVQIELDKMIDAGIPMTYEEVGQIIEVKKLPTSHPSPKAKLMTAAE